MTAGSDLKQCPFCAEDIKSEAIVCRFCGHDLKSQNEYLAPPNSVANVSIEKDNSMGFSIASIILGIITIIIGLIDLGSIDNYTYTYIEDTEIGLLFILSFTSLGFGITASVKKQLYWIPALVISIISVVIFLACTGYSSAVISNI